MARRSVAVARLCFALLVVSWPTQVCAFRLKHVERGGVVENTVRGLKSFSSSFDGGFMFSDARIKGYMPSSGTNLPVFIYLTGTVQSFWEEGAKLFVREMAKRGYIAAQVEYQNRDYPLGTKGCQRIQTKARRIFVGPNSAASKLCAMRRASCSNGLAVSGFSQGSEIASMSEQLNKRVSAVLLLGHGDRLFYTGMISSRPCMRSSYSKRRLPPAKRRQVIGDRDQFFGWTTSIALRAQKATTGYNCGDSLKCIKKDGSGYYIVSKINKSQRSHCFFYEATVSCQGKLTVAFRSTKAAWGMKSNLDWLARAAKRSRRLKLTH